MSARKPPPGRGPRPAASNRSQGGHQAGGPQTGPRAAAHPGRPSSRGESRPGESGARTNRRSSDGKPRGLWLYGLHAVVAALANPHRVVLRLLATTEGEERLREAGATLRPGQVTNVERPAIERHLPAGAVHQGIAAEVEPLPAQHIEDVIERAGDRTAVLVLDQVSDPQNIGAILRTAAAFGAVAVIVPERGAPEATGALAKAAAGALERVPLVRVVNLKRALETLKGAGFWCHGFDGEGDSSIAEADLDGRVALVLGAEGEGLRPLTRTACDRVLRIPIAAAMESLNVSNAAAIALYEWARRLPTA